MKKVQIIKNENGKEAVLCSDLYRGLELSKSQFRRWIKKNISNNPFAILGTDYVPTNRPNVEKTKDFVLSLEFAKHLAMQCRTQKGYEVRKYFLLCEQRAKQLENETITALKKSYTHTDDWSKYDLHALHYAKKLKH